MFDTLKFVNRLKAAGVPEAQAEAFSDAFKEAQGEAELATKADIAEVKHDIEALRLATKADLRAEIADVRTEIERMGRVIIMWMVGIAIGATLGMAGIFIAIIRAMVPGA